MRGQRILLVEDEALISYAFEAMLTDAGYDVLTAPDGKSALSELERDSARFDCLITDIRMPGMDGWEAARAVRASPEIKDTPILAATAMFRDSDLKTCMEAGCNSYIVKPFTFLELQSKIRELLPQSKDAIPS